MRILVAVLVLTATVATVPSVYALDPHKSINQYGLNIWLQQNGLPANAVDVSLQTRNGYIWFGTSAGLFRFDGVHFEPVVSQVAPGNSLGAIISLCESNDSSLLVGTSYSGLYRLKNGAVRQYGPEDGLIERQILSLFESHSGHLWVGTSNGLFRSVGDRFIAIAIDETFFPSIAEDPRGRIWVGTHKGVRVFEDRGEAPTLSFDVTVGLPNSFTSALFADDEGTVWIGTNDGLVRWHNGQIKTFSYADGLPGTHITAFEKDRDGNLWVGTTTGLARLAGGNWTAFTNREGLSHSQVKSLLEDREGSIWVSTLDGLNRLKDVYITPFTTKEGLGSDYVTGVTETGDGSIFFCSSVNSTVTRMKDGKFTIMSIPNGPQFAARDGSLWIAQTGVLININKGNITRYDESKGLPPKWISAITEDNQSLIVFLDHTGVRRFTGGKLQPYLLKNGEPYLSTEYVECFYPEPNGTLWIGTTKGLLRVQKGDTTLFGPAQGLTDFWVSSIVNDRRGILWISSPHGGFARYRDGKFIPYTTKSGLFTKEIYSVLADDDGDIWMSSPRGIGRVGRQDLDDYASGRISTVRCQVYTIADGMKTDACFDEWQPAGIRAQDGRLWFATKKGAVMIDPKVQFRNENLPPVLIEGVVAGNRTILPDQFINIPPGKQELEFHYTALSLLVPERVLFKYRLEGYDRDWVDAGTRRVAYYTNLWPGNYRFRVIGCNNDGMWNETGASMEFYLAPRFYQTYWFAALSACVLMLTVFGIYRLRVRALRENERQLAELVNARTKELEQQRSLLHVQRSFLRKVIDLIPSFIFARDKQGRFTLANLALARSYGTTTDELIGKTDADYVSKEDAEKFLQDDQQVLKSGTEKVMPEEEYTRKEGDRGWLQVIKIPITSEDGRGQELLGVATDITLQKNATLEMQLAKEVAEAATRSKSEFLANMSHEIRTPMNAVIGMTGLLLDTNLSAEQREFVEIVRTSSDALLTIINDILDFSKIESGKLDLEHQAFNIANCIEESLDLLSSKAVEKGIELAYLLDENTPHGILGDVTRLRQILVNLLGNALKFTHKGEVVVSVTARRREGNQHELEFSVRDTGIGIPKDRMDRLFKSFSQVDSSTTRQYGGTGLGLAISKRLSELMGGTMWVESQEGHGSTFYFTIVAFSAPTAARLSLHSDPHLNGKRVLIVDDNATNRRILTVQTRAWGMIPETVAGGSEALNLLKRGTTFDLAILDMHMPGMDGLTLSVQLRQMPGARTIPLVMLTSGAASKGQLSEQYRNFDFAAFLSKPIKPSQLYDVLMSVLGDHKTLQKIDTPPPRLNADMGKELPLRILLAEDNVVNQKVALRILERFGYRADVANNGVEAVDAIRRLPYDVVFMDVHMPEMDGLEATRRICAEWPETRPRIIAMTANATDGDREKCLASGMDGFISKPVRIEELRVFLEQLGTANKQA